MDLKYGSPAREPFVTNVGLITSDGPHGQNIMAAEWTFQVSYDPGLIAVGIGPGKATTENIEATKQFGVSIASQDQSAVSSIAGGSSGKKVDKIAALKELGFTFTEGPELGLPLVDNASLHVECNLVDQVTRGDHIVFIGEAVSITPFEGKTPLIYHSGKYFGLGEQLPKPSDEERANMKAIVEKNTKS